ncbi:Inner membrane protein [Escherichia coli]
MINKENSLTVGTINAIILVVPFWITVAVITTIIFK